jgi:hypothetical protein
MAQFEPLLWERHVRQPRTRFAAVSRTPIDPASEFAALPLGRLGRPLLDEVETYLAFFAVAREKLPEIP